MSEATAETSSTESSRATRRRGAWRWYYYLFSAVLLAWVGVLLVGIAAGIVAFTVYDHVTAPGVAGPPVQFSVEDGATGQAIGEALVERGLVEHPLFFRLAMRLEGSDRHIQSGVYQLPRGLSPLQYLEAMLEGPERQLRSNQVRVTIPEGLSIAQMAEQFDDPEAFLEAARDPDLIASLGIEADSLEGFLMPNTYFFDADPTEREVVERMLGQFKLEYGRLLATVPGAEQNDMREIVTIASLIEEEARADEERPIVASVIYNRLDENMLLGMDSTLQFALGKYGQRMLDRDKEVDSPYNTYRIRGLPPGPISNPGVASLRAAMQPAETEYRYFVSNADGRTHTFSETHREHLRAVERYRREIAVQRAEEARRAAEAAQAAGEG